MSVEIRQKDPSWLKKLLRRYESDDVLAVGYPASETGSIKYPDGTSVIMVAAVNNFGANINHPGGTPYVIGSDGMAHFVSKGFMGPVHGVTKPHVIGIPARAFMSEANEPAVKATAPIAEALIPLLNQGKLDIPEILKQMGPFAEAAFKSKVSEGPWEPNSASTVRKKGSSKPLIDTGLLRNSLTHVVRKA